MFRSRPRSGLNCALFILAALALGGCNLVLSDKPIFTADDATGAPPFRPGIWVAPEGGCKFDEAKPAATWPACAGGSVLTAAEGWSVDKPQKRSPYVLASGDPRVLQAIVDLADKTGDGDIKQKGPIYMFIAIKPVARDGQGRIIKAEGWFVQCGPPPPTPKADKSLPSPEAFGTHHPLPGMIMDGGACTPRDKAAVRRAAAASRAWSDQVMVMRWVRDGTA